MVLGLKISGSFLEVAKLSNHKFLLRRLESSHRINDNLRGQVQLRTEELQLLKEIEKNEAVVSPSIMQLKLLGDAIVAISDRRHR
jgi:hypothetical protein